VNEESGITIKKFNLIFTDRKNVLCKILYQGGIPITIDIQSDWNEFTCTRKLSVEEVQAITYEQRLKSSKAQFQEAELLQLIGK
jgi:hypothetical protein